MENYKLQLIETLLIVVSFLLIKFILKYFVKITIVNSYFKNSVRKEVIKLINLILFISFCVIIISIWSVKQENVLLFASTLLTVFGVALFSEKSILSNITSYIILFFQHNLKVGDTLSLFFNDQDIKGEITEISYFFIYIRTIEGERFTIPNSTLLKNPFKTSENQ